MLEGEGRELGGEGPVAVGHGAQVRRAGEGMLPLAGAQAEGDEAGLRQALGPGALLGAVVEEARRGAEPHTAIRIHPGGEGVAVGAGEAVLPPEEPVLLASHPLDAPGTAHPQAPRRIRREAVDRIAGEAVPAGPVAHDLGRVAPQVHQREAQGLPVGQPGGAVRKGGQGREGRGTEADLPAPDRQRPWSRRARPRSVAAQSRPRPSSCRAVMASAAAGPGSSARWNSGRPPGSETRQSPSRLVPTHRSPARSKSRTTGTARLREGGRGMRVSRPRSGLMRMRKGCSPAPQMEPSGPSLRV